MVDTASSVDREAARSASASGEPSRQATVHYLTPLIAPTRVGLLTRNASAAASGSKRLLDILASSIALLMFLPLLLVIAVAVRLETHGPALFRQRRTGLNGKIFTIYKFRTMAVAEDDDIRHATKNDSRVTPLGLVLRKCSLDELPQLLNIVKGDMSIVGPRPHAVSHDELYGAQIPAYNLRFRTKPGLTGLAQVSGLRGEVQALSCMADRVGADNTYIDNWSLGQDLLIILRTIPLMFRDPNAY